MQIKIIKDFIPVGSKNRPGRKNPMKYITVHNTGNTKMGADADNHASYLKGKSAGEVPASWHYTVDDKCIYQHLPDEEDAFHAGDGGGKGNRESIGIEICMNSDGDLLKATDNAAFLAATLCIEHGIDVLQVVQHKLWSGKQCPQKLIAGEPYNWNTFLNKVKNNIDELQKPVIEAPSAWAVEAWDWCDRNNILDGTRPKDGVTRQEIAQVVYNLYKAGLL